MSRVSPNPDGNTTQWEVMEWATRQACFMETPMHQCLLYYLSLKAFYNAENPEQAPIGQVLHQASFVQAMMDGTAIKSRQSIRRCLNDLQDQGYITRRERPTDGTCGQKPHAVTVLWEEEFEDYRKGLRNGSGKAHPMLLTRPVRKATKPRALAPVINLETMEREHG